MIFKVQKPLESTIQAPKAMAYNEDRSTMLMMPPKTVEKWFAKGELKIYVEAKLDGKDFNIIKKLTPQAW